MGKGDSKTRRGKTYRNSYGNTRPHASKTTGGNKVVAVAAKKAVPAVKKAAATAVKKTVAKKP